MLGGPPAPHLGWIWWAARRGDDLREVGGAQGHGERLVHALEYLVHAARLRPVAVLEVFGAGARHLEKRSLEGANGIGHGDLACRPREAIATRLPPRRADQTRPTQVADELLEIGVRQLLALRDLREREASLVLAQPTERDEDADAVFGAGADLHDDQSSLTRTSSPSTKVS